MGETRLEREIRLRRAAYWQSLAKEVRHAIDQREVSIRSLASAVGIDHGHLSRFLRTKTELSGDLLVAVATGLGFDVSVRLFESTGPRVRDHLQAAMESALLAERDRRYHPLVEVAVHRPARGVIDLVLQDLELGDLVATETHSAVGRVDQQVGWAAEKADSLPSAIGFPWGGPVPTPTIHRLLVLRSCPDNHRLVDTYRHLLEAAYPVPADEAVRALRTGGAWPGNAIVWVRLAGSSTRLLEGEPRALRRGR